MEKVMSDFMDAVNGPTYVIYGTTMNKLYDALRIYRAWEEGGGPTERAEGGVRGRLQAPPSEGAPSQDIAQRWYDMMRSAFKREACRMAEGSDELNRHADDFMRCPEMQGLLALAHVAGSILDAPPASAPPKGLENSLHVAVCNSLDDWRADDIFDEDGEHMGLVDLLAGPKEKTITEALARRERLADFICGEISFVLREHAAPPPPAGVDRPETEGEAEIAALSEEGFLAPGFQPDDPAPTPFTERMNELIAWAEERAEKEILDARSYENGSWSKATRLARASVFREVANHLRQLSQGAKTDEW